MSAGAHHDRVTPITEERGDWLSVQIIDADDSDRSVNRGFGNLAQEPATVRPRGAAIDPDSAFPLAGIDASWLQLHCGLCGRGGSCFENVIPILLLQAQLLLRLGDEIRERRRTVRMAEVDHHVRGWRIDCSGDATSQFGHLRHRHDAQVKRRDGQPGVSVGKHQHGGCQVTFDGLDWVGENADAGPANAKWRVDDGSGDAGGKRWHGRHTFLNQNTVA